MSNQLEKLKGLFLRSKIIAILVLVAVILIATGDLLDSIQMIKSLVFPIRGESAVDSTTHILPEEPKPHNDSGYVEPKFESEPKENHEEPKPNFQKVIAVLIREKIDAAFDDELGYYFSSKLKTPEHKIIPVTQLEKVFKAKSRFNIIYENGLLHSHRSQDYQGFLLLGIKERYFRSSEEHEGLVVADVTIRFNVISLSTGELINSFSMSSRKPGVSERQAYQYAIDDLKSDYSALTNSIERTN